MLEQIPKLFHGKAGISGDTAHGKRVDGVVTRNRDDPLTIAHHNVFSLTRDSKPGLLKRPDSVKMVDARNLRQDYTVTSIS